MPRRGHDFAPEEQGAATLRGTLHPHHVNPSARARRQGLKLRERPVRAYSWFLDHRGVWTLIDSARKYRSKMSSTYGGRCTVASHGAPNLTCLTRLPYAFQVPRRSNLHDAAEACSGGFAQRRVARGRVPREGRRSQVLARPTGCRLQLLRERGPLRPTRPVHGQGVRDAIPTQSARS